MTHIATTGMGSCALISMSGFSEKGNWPFKHKTRNEQYKEDPSSWTAPEPIHDKEPGCGTVADFYNDILYPTIQNLGRTGEYPFERLMEDVEKCGLKSKMIFACINSASQNDGYWPAEFERWGFKLVDKTTNSIGSTNYIYVRCPLRVKINAKEGEHVFGG